MMLVFVLFEIIFLIITIIALKSFLKQPTPALKAVYACVTLFFLYLSIFQMPKLILELHEKGTQAESEAMFAAP